MQLIKAESEISLALLFKTLVAKSSFSFSSFISLTSSSSSGTFFNLPQAIFPRKFNSTSLSEVLLTEVEQEQRPSGNGDREAIVVGAGLCDGEGELAYFVNDPIVSGEKYLKCFKGF